MTAASALKMFRDVRTRTIDMVAGCTQAELDYTPSPVKWTPGAILDHILLSEKVYRDQISELIGLARSGRRPRIVRSTREVDFSPIFLPKSLLPLLEVPLTLMNLFVPTALREWMVRYAVIPGQNPEVARPQVGRPAEELRRELETSIEQTAALIESNPDLDFSRMIAQHAVLGVNNVPELLRIVALHEERHQDQISTILRGMPRGDAQ